MSYHAWTAIRENQTYEGAIAPRCDSPLGRKATAAVLTDTLNPTEFLPSIGGGGGERLYDLVDNISPEAGDIVRKAGREVGLDLSGDVGIGMSKRCVSFFLELELEELEESRHT